MCCSWFLYRKRRRRVEEHVSSCTAGLWPETSVVSCTCLVFCKLCMWEVGNMFVPSRGLAGADWVSCNLPATALLCKLSVSDVT